MILNISIRLIYSQGFYAWIKLTILRRSWSRLRLILRKEGSCPSSSYSGPQKSWPLSPYEMHGSWGHDFCGPLYRSFLANSFSRRVRGWVHVESSHSLPSREIYQPRSNKFGRFFLSGSERAVGSVGVIWSADSVILAFGPDTLSLIATSLSEDFPRIMSTEGSEESDRQSPPPDSPLLDYSINTTEFGLSTGWESNWAS